MDGDFGKLGSRGFRQVQNVKKSHFILWVPFVVYYLFITGLSSVSGQAINDTFTLPFPYFDKVVHFFLYLFLGMVLARALSWEEYYHHLKRRWYVYFLLIVPLVSFVDEVHQYFVPNRSMDVLDWGADISGAIFGAFLFVVFIKGRKRDYKDATTEFQAMVERDVRGFGLVLAMVFFMVLISINLFKYRYGFLSHYTNFTFMIILIEFGLLGLLTIRFFYLRRDRKYFHVSDWLMLVLTGVIFLVVYQFTLIYLQKRSISAAEIMWSLFCFVSGGIFYYLDKQIDRFRKKILKDPVYKRKTWQRVYFFFPPAVVIFLISFLSAQSPTVLYQTHLPLPSDIVPAHGPLAIFQNLFFLHGIQFFVFGAFFFRAITWESWWHPESRRKWVWCGSYLFLIFYAFFDEFFIQSLTPGRMPDPYDSVTDILGGTVAMIVYLFGYRMLKEKYFNDQIPK